MIACAETRKDVAVVGAKLAYRDQTVQHAGIAICQGDGLPRHIYRGFPVDHPAVTRDRAFQAVTGACMLVRSDAFDLVRGFDERFANGYEDIDLCLRLHGRGYRTWYCGTTDVVHLESVSLRDSNQHAEALNDPNSALFQARWSNLVSRDEIAIYASDGLISVQSGDVYPLKIVCAPELAELAFQGHDSELARLLGIRSRQVFDLEKDLGYLMARLLDHGVSL
jgi:GT2 family glycosyltransferase